MTATVTALWRHPIKAHGRQSLQRMSLQVGQCMPFDRHWAVTHEATKADGTEWARCINFSRGASSPSLMALTANLDEATGLLTMQHPDLEDLTFDPNTQGDVFIDWVRPIMPEKRRQSTGLIQVPGVGMTDSSWPSISLINDASNAALGDTFGTQLNMDRWRGNIHMTGLSAWEEFDWLDKTLRIGSAEFEVRERIERCSATTVDPTTGDYDFDTLKHLRDHFGHRDFGVKIYVTKAGDIAVGDTLEVL